LGVYVASGTLLGQVQAVDLLEARHA
jgi:hypothetical protein